MASNWPRKQVGRHQHVRLAHVVAHEHRELDGEEEHLLEALTLAPVAELPAPQTRPGHRRLDRLQVLTQLHATSPADPRSRLLAQAVAHRPVSRAEQLVTDIEGLFRGWVDRDDVHARTSSRPRASAHPLDLPRRAASDRPARGQVRPGAGQHARTPDIGRWCVVACLPPRGWWRGAAGSRRHRELQTCHSGPAGTSRSPGSRRPGTRDYAARPWTAACCLGLS